MLGVQRLIGRDYYVKFNVLERYIPVVVVGRETVSGSMALYVL